MLDAYASNGLPFGYPHWSFGYRFLRYQAQHDAGLMGLAYEVVINSDPAVAYCMEDNTLTMQALVIAHAGFGHNAFFANNYLFKQWTNPKGILDYLRFAGEYIRECEENHGIDDVEKVLDACHALSQQGVDHYRHAADLSTKQRELRRLERLDFMQKNLKKHWDDNLLKSEDDATRPFPEEPEAVNHTHCQKNRAILLSATTDHHDE
jgi:stage V sporulation protein R